MLARLHQLICNENPKQFKIHTLPSASADITFPRADRDLLMFLASSRTAPSAPVLLTCTNNITILSLSKINTNE